MFFASQRCGSADGWRTAIIAMPILCNGGSVTMSTATPAPTETDFQTDEDIDDEAQTSDRDNDVPGIERYTLGFYGADYPIDALHKRLHRADDGGAGDIEIPDFQRGYVWSRRQADRFIESLLLGLPVPGIFLTQDPETKRQQIIDGVQRLLTIKRFMDGESQPLQDVHSDFEGKTYAALSTVDTREFNDRIIHATIVRQDRDDSDRRPLAHLFDRLNTGGTPAQPHEVRKSLWRGSLNELIESLDDNEDWRSVYGKPSRRVKDQELILRFIALYKSGDRYGRHDRTMKDFLTSYMAENRNISAAKVDSIRHTFEEVINLVSMSLGKDAFRPAARLNTAVFDAVMVGLAHANDAGSLPDTAAFLRSYSRLLRSDEFRTATSDRTSHAPNVETRLRLAREAFGAQGVA